MMTTNRRGPASSGRTRAGALVRGMLLVATGSLAAAPLVPTAARAAAFPVVVQEAARVWVLPFVGVDAPGTHGDLGEYIGGLLEVLLSHSRDLSVVDRQYLDRVLGEHDLALRWPSGDQETRRLGRMLGASVVISGSFGAHEDALLISAHAYDVDSGRLLGSASATGAPDDAAALVERIHGALVNDLGTALPAPLPHQVDLSPLANLHFLQGLSLYYAARYPQALAEFIDSAREPRLELVARLWMANCYLADAQYGHAYLELRRLQVLSSFRLDEIERKLDLCRENLSQEEILRLDRLVPTAQIVVDVLPEYSQVATGEEDGDHHYFGQQDVELAVRISGESDGPVHIRARLHQLAFALSVLHGAPVEVASDIVVSEGRPTTIRVLLALPAVERETSFNVVFSARNNVSTQWVEAGRALLRVYPADLVAPLRAWSRTTRLRVQDDQGTLRRFLTAKDIAFVDARESRAPNSGEPVVRIVVGDAERLDYLRPSSATNETTVVFRETTNGLPKVTVRPRGAGQLVVVEMEIIEALDRDPRAQKALVEILQLTLPGALQ
jgi:TolB-like protein